MLLKVAELSETLVAEVAGVRFHTGVDADVLSQVARVSKRLCAVRTLMGLRLCVIPEEGEQHKKEGGLEIRSEDKCINICPL